MINRMKIRNRKIATTAQNGYALLMVMFMATVVLLGAMVATPYLRTERQREKEAEMIWRGKQYVRGVKMYYRKTGRFPTSMDDLTKPKLGSLRFMRQAYKDPMNKEDGSWRMIYVGPGGQLIGSLKPPQQNFQMPGQLGTPAAATSQPVSSFGNSSFGQSAAAQPSPGTQQGPATQNGTNPPQPGTAPAANTAATDAAAANATPSGLVSSDSPVLGGNIIGVGSKVNKRSVVVYDKAKNYRLFEFIWNPSKDVANAINQQIGTPNNNRQGTGQTGAGQTGFGQNNPQGNPPNNQNNQNNQQNPGAIPPDMPMPTPPPENPPE
jgi:hypothetical protein